MHVFNQSVNTVFRLRFSTAKAWRSIITMVVSTNLLLGCNSTVNENKQNHLPAVADFVYYDQTQLEAIQAEVSKGNTHYLNALASLEKKAKKAIKQPLDSVMNKPTAAASGDKHDYLSISPYFWPDPEKADGLPWLYKDGQVNPKTRGIHTDQTRASNFLEDLGTLFIAYTYTGNEVYAENMKAKINTWLVDPATKMNPHLNYAQGMPGRNQGSSFGIIEWASISNIVSAMQVLKANSTLNANFVFTVDKWFSDYLHWLLTSDLGIHESTRKNNHGPWYDYQVVGIMLYLNRVEDAKAYFSTTQRRIEQHFLGDGAQPHELKRTKSINYASMNLQALIQLAYMGSKVGIDLWGFQGDKGQSLAKGVSYFYPYLRGETAWQYKQIWRTIEEAYVIKTYPMLHITRAHFGKNTVPEDIYSKIVPTLDAKYILLHKAQ